MKNRIISLLFLFIIFFIYFIFEICKLKLPCIFLMLFNIECPACGFTRAFRCMFEFKFLEAFSYNILSIPLAIIVVISILMLLYDLVFNKDTFLKNISTIICKSYIVILLALVVSCIYNNIVR